VEKGLRLPSPSVTAQARKFRKGGNFLFQLNSVCVFAVELWDRFGVLRCFWEWILRKSFGR